MNLCAEDIIKILDLQPLTGEGGYYRETYRSNAVIASGSPELRSAGTAIYYLLSGDPRDFSELHRLDADETFHFYLGDPVEMLLLHPNGPGETIILGGGITGGMNVQVTIPAGVWQGSRLMAGGRFALMGSTVTPGFEFSGYRSGNREMLIREYPFFRDIITQLTRSVQ